MRFGKKLKKIPRKINFIFFLKTSVWSILLEWRSQNRKEVPHWNHQNPMGFEGVGLFESFQWVYVFPVLPWELTPSMCQLRVGSRGGDVTACASTITSLSFLLLQLFWWAWLLRDSACGFCVWGDCRDLKGCVWGKAKLSLHVCTLWITHLGLAHSLCVGCSFAQAKIHMGEFRLSTCANWRISHLTIGPKTQNWWFTGSAKITGHILWWRNLALHYWNWRSFADLHQLRIWA